MLKKVLSIFLVLMFMPTCGCSQKKDTSTGSINLLDYSLRSVNGDYVNLSTIKAKVIIVDFWDTWCPPCKVEIPGFISLYKKYHSKGLEILGLALGRRGVGDVLDFVTQKGINYPCYIASDDIISAFGGIRGIPTTFVLNSKGEIYRKYVGMRPISVFENDIQDLLKSEGK